MVRLIRPFLKEDASCAGSWAHSETPLEVLQRGVREVEAATIAPLHPRTPLQRLQQFAADTGVPVSFEIAEAAMKGGGW